MADVSCHLILDRLFIGLRLPRSHGPIRLSLRDGGGAVLAAFDASEASPDGRDVATPITVASIGRLFSRQHVIVFLASPALTHAPVLARLAEGALSVHLDVDDQEHRLPLTVTELSLDSIVSLHEPIANHLKADESIGALVAAFADGTVRPLESPAMHPDLVVWDRGALFVHGWLGGVPLADVFFLTDGLAHCSPGMAGVVHNRPDVSDFLRSTGIVPDSDAHGFSVVVRAARPSSQLTVVAAVNGEYRVIFSAPASAQGTRENIFPILLRSRRDDAPASLDRIAALMAPFLPGSRAVPEAEAVRRCSRAMDGGKPELSIVIPFYKQWRFIFSVCKLIQRALPAWEWVVVCDDPAIFGELSRYIAAQPDAVRDRITLVRLAHNGGFGAANNIGVREAAAETVLLMNSDVWFASFEPVAAAMSALDAGRFGLVGFELRFEDGTIQHDGMIFAAKPELDGLHLVLHPGKGLPPAEGRTGVALVERELVTGALMMLKRSTYLEVGGFSPDYIGGDFEDADLCLWVKRRGMRIGMVASDAVFHLERQSIRKDAENAVAFARTLTNCVTFNRKWRAVLAPDAM